MQQCYDHQIMRDTTDPAHPYVWLFGTTSSKYNMYCSKFYWCGFSKLKFPDKNFSYPYTFCVNFNWKFFEIELCAAKDNIWHIARLAKSCTFRFAWLLQCHTQPANYHVIWKKKVKKCLSIAFPSGKIYDYYFFQSDHVLVDVVLLVLEVYHRTIWILPSFASFGSPVVLLLLLLLLLLPLSAITQNV